MLIRTFALLAAGAALGLQAGCASQAPAVTHLNSGKVLPTGLPFSEAVRVGNTVYLSGQLGNVPGPGPIKLAPGGMAGEAKQVMDNIQTTLQAHGLSMADVVKCTVMLADMNDWPAFNTLYRRHFSAPYPARSAFGGCQLALGGRLEIEAMAVVTGAR